MKYLVIGNGVAGTEAAVTIKNTDKNADVTLISRSEKPFYFRPGLIDYLAGEKDFEKIIRYQESFYREKNIKTALGTEITDIDMVNKKVHTKNGRIFDYDRLLLATGARPFVPDIAGVDKKGVFSIRETEDADAILSYIKELNNILVIGGGILGIETAYSLIKQGKKVTVIEYADRLLPRQLDKESGKILKEILARKGIEFVLGAEVKEITGGSRATGVTLATAEHIDADAIIYSIGVRSRTDLGKKSGLSINRGIIVNDFMETSEKDIYAAGDVAEHENKCYGLWMPAMKQGQTAGMNMAGNREKFMPIVAEVRLKVAGVSLFSAGDISGDHAETRIFKNDEKYTKLLIKNKRLIGAIVLGAPKLTHLVAQTLTGEKSIDELLTNMERSQ